MNENEHANERVTADAAEQSAENAQATHAPESTDAQAAETTHAPESADAQATGAAAAPPEDQPAAGHQPAPSNAPAPAGQESALDERERELRRRELRLLALDALCARELPPELLPVLPLEDEAALRNALDGVECAFRRAVEGSVQKRMAGAPPTLPAGGPAARELALRRAMGLE